MKKGFIFILLFSAFVVQALTGTPSVTWGGLYYQYHFFHQNTDFVKSTNDGNSYVYIHGDISATVDFGNDITGYLSVGAWGQHGMSPYHGGGLGENIDPSARILQGYITVGGLFDLPLAIRFGKERLLYGDGAVMFDGGEDGATGYKIIYSTPVVTADLFYYRYAQMGGIANVGSGLDIYPGNWNIAGIYPTIKVSSFNISSYFVSRIVELGPDSTDKPYWAGVRMEGAVSMLSLVFEYTLMGGKNELSSSPVNYAGKHLQLRAEFTIQNLYAGAGFWLFSGDDTTTTDDNEQYQSATHGPYTCGFYKDWPGFGPAHLLTTGWGFSGLDIWNSTLFNTRIINLHAGANLGALSIRLDFFKYGRDQQVGNYDNDMGYETAIMIKYTWKESITFGFTAGIWSPGKYFEDSLGDVDNVTAGYFWLAKSF